MTTPDWEAVSAPDGHWYIRTRRPPTRLVAILGNTPQSRQLAEGIVNLIEVAQRVEEDTDPADGLGTALARLEEASR